MLKASNFYTKQEWCKLLTDLSSGGRHRLRNFRHNFLQSVANSQVRRVDTLRKRVKCTLVQALRLCTGRTAHRGSRGMALPFHDHGPRSGWGVSVTPRPLFTRGKTRYPLYRSLGGPQGRSGQVRKISPPPGIVPRTVQPVAIRYTYYATRLTVDTLLPYNWKGMVSFLY